MLEHLVRTKVTVPPTRASLVTRESLLARLDAGFAHRVILISAPAGFGKTTLLTEWVARFSSSDNTAQRRVAWFSIDESDNDPATYWGYFSGALECVEPTAGFVPAMSLPALPVRSEPTIAGGVAEPRTAGETFKPTSLLNALANLTEPLWFVLDDYHNIHSEEIHRSLAYFIEHMPSHLHMVLSSRMDPPLPIARLRAGGALLELRAADLRFRPEEAGALLNQVMGLGLSEPEVAALEQRTEGWAAALQLAALSLQGSADASAIIAAFDGGHRYIIDYLFEEVLSKLPPATREFLSATAVLERFCAPLCDFMAARTDSARILDELERANLFLLPLDERREWLRYHYLFAEFLRAQLTETERIRYYHIAADWFAGQKMYHQAVAYSIQTKNEDRIEQAISAAITYTMEYGEIHTLLSWLDVLPDVRIRRNFWLAASKAFALSIQGRLEQADSYAASADASLPPNPTDEVRAFSLGLKSDLALSHWDVPNILIYARQSLALTPESNKAWRSFLYSMLGRAEDATGDSVSAMDHLRQSYEIGLEGRNLFGALVSLALYSWQQFERGGRSEIQTLAQDSLAVFGGSKQCPSPLAGIPNIIIGQACLLANDLESASEHIRTGLLLTENLSEYNVLFWGLALLAQISRRLGREDECQKHLSDMRRLVQQVSWLTETWEQFLADFQSRSGEWEPVAAWLATQSAILSRPPEPRQRMTHLVSARYLLAHGKAPESALALEALERLVRAPNGLSQFTPLNPYGMLVQTLLLRARCSAAQGGDSQAQALLREAILLSAPEDCRRVFLEDGAGLKSYLPSVRSAAPAFVDAIIQAFEIENHPALESANPPSSMLTARESEVLQLMANGLRNQEIADTLVISLATVKRHISNINDKLGADHRTGAIARARERNLLS